MTELNNISAGSETDEDELKPPSPWTMVISMLLLIFVLILSSAMLMHYALDGAEGSTGKPTFDFAKLIEKGKKITARPVLAETPSEAPPSVQAPPKSANSGVKKFFSGGEKSKIRWPKLKLTGFGKSVDGKGGFAIINGDQILVDASIKEVKLVEILTHGVVVEYKDERKTLSVEIAH